MAHNQKIEKPSSRSIRRGRLTAAAASRTVATMTHGAGGNMRPTSTRGIVFAITLAVLQYIDRVAWAIVFAWWYRDDPRAHPGVNAAEAALLPPPAAGGDHLHVPWRRMAAAVVWVAFGLRADWGACSEAAGAARPNIVWLTVEDMSPWIGPYGDRTVPTPNLDRLAGEGVVYDNAFATSPVCAPARSSLITGMFCTRIGTMQMRNRNPSRAAVDENPEAYRDIPDYEGLPPSFVRCFPELLRAAGYSCTNNSKKDHQFQEPVTVWDESSTKAHWQNRFAGKPFCAVFNFMGTHESQGFPQAERRPEVVAPEHVPLPPFYLDTPHVRDAVARTYNNIAAMDRWVGERIQELKDAELLDTTIAMFFSDHGVGLPRGKRSCFDTGLPRSFTIQKPIHGKSKTSSMRRSTANGSPPSAALWMRGSKTPVIWGLCFPRRRSSARTFGRQTVASRPPHQPRSMKGPSCVVTRWRMS
jgi:hypothetical protein